MQQQREHHSSEGVVELVDNIKVSYQEWGISNVKKVIALHGWLDNSNSFAYLGPYLANVGFHVVAVDHIGHGHSDHIGRGGSYTMNVKLVSAVKQVLDTLLWDKCDVIGHSMGANIGLMFAASFPERVNKFIMIEGIGPLVKPAEQTPKCLRNAIEKEIIITKKTSQSKWYKTFGEAIAARLAAVKQFPGEQFISHEAVNAIVSRAVRFQDNREGEPINETDGPVQFCHDPKLLYPSPIYHTIEQAKSYLVALTAKTQIILGEQGFPLDFHVEFQDRTKILTDKGLLTLVTLPGSHHLHLDPDHAPKVAETINLFLNE